MARFSRFARSRTEPSGNNGAAAAIDRDAIVRAAEERIAADDNLAAIDLLSELADQQPDAALDQRLRELRHTAGFSLSEQAGRPEWPPRYNDPFPDLVGEIPECAGSAFDVEMMGGAVRHHGALLIRNLLTPEIAAELAGMIDQIQDSDSCDTSMYAPVDTGRKKDDSLRANVGEQGGTWLADSPTATRRVMGMLREVGVVDAVQEHFGERPAFSLQKSTLRRVQPQERLTAWHQDGSFLSDDVRTMNIWIALSDCGGDYPASGLELMPRRVDELLELEPDFVRSAVSFAVVDELAAETAVVNPAFRAGDALMFDERFLHRTALGPGLTAPRYALECWFFAPSHTNETYVSFAV